MGDTAKQFSLQNFRPEGFAYPIGLSSFNIVTVANAAATSNGGTQTIDGTNGVHTFTSSAVFSANGGNMSCEVLVIGGGGSGGGGGAELPSTASDAVPDPDEVPGRDPAAVRVDAGEGVFDEGCVQL